MGRPSAGHKKKKDKKKKKKLKTKKYRNYALLRR